MKLKIKTNFSFSKLKDKYKKIQKEFITESINKEAVKMKKRVATATTVSGAPMEPIKESTVKVRGLMRQNIMNPPLNASGKLLNSIKAKKTGVGFKKYGIYHNEKYTVKNNPVIPPKGKSEQKNLKRRQFFFEGKTVPARKWVHDTASYRSDEKTLEKYYKKIKKALKK
jgi:hypothetical protein